MRIFLFGMIAASASTQTVCTAQPLVQSCIYLSKHNPRHRANTREHPGDTSFASTALETCEQGVHNYACHRLFAVSANQLYDPRANERSLWAVYSLKLWL